MKSTFNDPNKNLCQTKRKGKNSANNHYKRKSFKLDGNLLKIKNNGIEKKIKNNEKTLWKWETEPGLKQIHAFSLNWNKKNRTEKKNTFAFIWNFFGKSIANKSIRYRAFFLSEFFPFVRLGGNTKFPTFIHFNFSFICFNKKKLIFFNILWLFGEEIKNRTELKVERTRVCESIKKGVDSFLSMVFQVFSLNFICLYLFIILLRVMKDWRW